MSWTLTTPPRPLAQEIKQHDPTVRLIAVHDVKRDMVYGLAFYRNQPMIHYEDGVPDQDHILVIPTGDQAALDRLPHRPRFTSHSFFTRARAWPSTRSSPASKLGSPAYLPCFVSTMAKRSVVVQHGKKNQQTRYSNRKRELHVRHPPNLTSPPR